MLYPLSYRGRFSTASHVNTSNTDVKRVYLQLKQTKRDRPRGRSLLCKRKRSLSRAGVFLGLGEHATTVQRIVDDLAHCRSFGINIHSVAGLQVSDDALGSDLEGEPAQLGIAPRLNMIDPHKPLIQRQVCIKSHDCSHSSRLKSRVQCMNYRCSNNALGCSLRPRQTLVFGAKTPKHRFGILACRRGVQRNARLYRTNPDTSIFFFAIMRAGLISGSSAELTEGKQVKVQQIL
jgi:hypothetical protein